MTTKPHKPTKKEQEILRGWLDRGLCRGAGDGKASACLEQAVALACGLPLTDKPDSCVAKAVSAFGRGLNDAQWSSPEARAKGLTELAFAQLGTADPGFDERRFTEKLAELTIRRVLPIALRAAGFQKEARRCEKEGSKDAAFAAADAADAADAAGAAAYAARTAANAANAAYAAANAAYAAAYAANAAAYAERDRVLTLSASCAVEAIAFGWSKTRD